jgi:transglutaminase-like putative cysteine protease
VTITQRYRVQHSTEYRYLSNVVHAHHLLHLTPRHTANQTCDSQVMTIDPQPARINTLIDAFGNSVSTFEIDWPHSRFVVKNDIQVVVNSDDTLDAHVTLPWNRVRDQLGYSARPRGIEELEASRFRMESPHVRLKRALWEYSRECFPRNRPLLECADMLLDKLHRELHYAPNETTIGTSVMELLESRRGVCQDFAHLMIACLRAHGLAARYVSGYLRTIPPPGSERLVGADASHAWVSVYAPPVGWVDLDPTNGIRVATDHITLGWGRDFSDVSPLRGVIVGGGQHELSVQVTVDLIPEVSSASTQSSNYLSNAIEQIQEQTQQSQGQGQSQEQLQR